MGHSIHCRCNLCLTANQQYDAQYYTMKYNPQEKYIEWTETILKQITTQFSIPQHLVEPMPTLANLRELLIQVHHQDQDLLVEKDKSYEGSWKNDGGIGAYFTFKRPIDRFIAIAKRNGYDLFKVWKEEEEKGILFKDGTLSACVLDIRCYMALLQTEMTAQKKADNYQYKLPTQSTTTHPAQ